ncbi:hypothetical protein GPECTOR_7g1026 [Gonium pectorale]|uniref:Uncharacterized protein n=1 Tax=Gonium pectorale TaxID=33097 RepID=A0A150GTE5_GONPE|nr:hypothetical protein GPECTOR_7g1026 [Gonium pectorale]|eukprot:KXZ53135.1 hypothetical protein GPECTOR_7g1026 [Gonium pectorale]
MQLSLIDPESFKNDFNLASFLAGIAKHVLDPRSVPPGPKPDTSTAAAAAKVSLDKARALLEVLKKAEAESQYVHGEVARSVSALQGSLAAEQNRFQKALTAASRQSEAVREAFRELESRSNRVGQVGTKLGDRLQRADALRSRSLELVGLLEHLASFARLPEGEAAFGEGGGLPGLFWEERKMAEAASTVRKLRALTSEAESARQRNRLAGAAAAAADEQDAGGAAGGGSGRVVEGSLEHCTRRLGQYCAWLERRVLARFDAAVESDNLRRLGECARVLAALDKEEVAVQRYITLLPAFQSSLDSLPWLREPAITADDAVVAERLRPLERLFGTLAETVEVEALRMSSVFPNPAAALQLLAARVFGDRVARALESPVTP